MEKLKRLLFGIQSRINLQITRILWVLFLILLLGSSLNNTSNADWTAYNGGDDCNHFSALTEINSTNVA